MSYYFLFLGKTIFFKMENICSKFLTKRYALLVKVCNILLILLKFTIIWMHFETKTRKYKRQILFIPVKTSAHYRLSWIVAVTYRFISSYRYNHIFPIFNTLSGEKDRYLSYFITLFYRLIIHCSSINISQESLYPFTTLFSYSRGFTCVN